MVQLYPQTISGVIGCVLKQFLEQSHLLLETTGGKGSKPKAPEKLKGVRGRGGRTYIYFNTILSIQTVRRIATGKLTVTLHCLLF